MNQIDRLEESLTRKVIQARMGRGARNRKSELGDLSTFGRLRAQESVPNLFAYFRGYIYETGVVLA